MRTSSINHWMDARGSHGPTPEPRLQPLLALTPAPECPRDGDDLLGTNHGVLVLKEAPDRLLMTQAAASEHGADARPCRQPGQARGLPGPAACSADAHRGTALTFPLCCFDQIACGFGSSTPGKLLKRKRLLARLLSLKP